MFPNQIKLFSALVEATLIFWPIRVVSLLFQAFLIGWNYSLALIEAEKVLRDRIRVLFSTMSQRFVEWLCHIINYFDFGCLQVFVFLFSQLNTLYYISSAHLSKCIRQK